MSAVGLYSAPTADGWAIYLSDGRIVARFRGLFARRRALRYLASVTDAQGAARDAVAWPTRRKQPPAQG